MRRWSVVVGAVLVAASASVTVCDVLGSHGEEASGAQAAAQPMTPEELDHLLAPVALYPDQLLAQMLLSAADPPQVQKLGDWLETHKALTGTELQEAAQAQGFEPSFVALALFPQVVDLMVADSKWTTRLGQAFANDRSGVFASIQRLRAESQKLGNLKDTPQQLVETRTVEGGQQVIVIEPANPQVVYVPQYNPQVVYTQPAQTVVVQEDDDDGAAVAAGVIGFAAGVAIGAAIDNDYYHGPYGYRGGFHMYNDAWDDYYDAREDAREDYYEHREDAREDYQDRREDLSEERTERAGTAQEQRTERQGSRQENRPETQAAREQRRTEAQGAAQQARSSGTASAAQQSRSAGTASTATYGSGTRTRTQSSTSVDRSGSGTKSDAFSGYSSGKAERSASSRGQRSRSASRGGGGGRRR